MAEHKQKKTVLKFGSTVATDIASALTAATLGFGCNVLVTSVPKETRATEQDESRFCPEDGGINKKTTADAIDVSDLTMNGTVDKGDTGYDAAAEVLRTAFSSNSAITVLVIHPDGVQKRWATGQLTEFNEPEADGGPDEKIKFTLGMAMHTRLSEV